MPPSQAPDLDRLRRAYDKQAAVYDRSAGRVESLLLGDFRRGFAAALHGRSLEVAVGSGLNLPHYPAAVTEGVGLDLSAEMLRRARQRARDLRLPLAVVQGDAQRLPFPDAAFDSVGVSLALCTIPDPEAALREVARVCRPEGTVVLLEHVLSPSRPVATLERLLTPLQVRLIGCHLDRETVDLARRLGFRVDVEASRVLGVFRLVVARPPLPG